MYQLSIIRDCGFKVSEESVILDLGCGNGDNVKKFIDRGYKCLGCDLKFKDGKNVEDLSSRNLIRLVDSQSYRLPFDDATFDIILSNQVFEHVQNYRDTLRETRRVLKPEGVCLHIFPSRYRIIESHVFVPFASIYRKYWWLRLWATLGIRKTNQKDKKPALIAQENLTYLVNNTNYLTKKELEREFSSYFVNVCFAEKAFLKNSPNTKGRMLFALVKLFPFTPSIYRTLRSRVVALANSS